MVDIWRWWTFEIFSASCRSIFFLQIDEDISEINENTSGNDTSDFSSRISDHDIIQLSNNFIPKGLIPLEKLFDQNDVLWNPQPISSPDDI